MYPALNDTDKETEAIIWERLHHGAEVAEIGAIRRTVRIAYP
jgi:hypothetical protein